MEWLLGLALAASLAGLLTPWKELSVDLARWLPKLLATIQMAPFIILTYLFMSDDIGYELVRLNGGGEMPLGYRISAVWAGREGPLLLWAALLALCGALFQPGGRGETSILFRRLSHGAVLAVLSVTFVMEPFRPATAGWRSQLNPLLQTDLMVIHPPLLFLFYSLCIMVTLHALAAMLSSEEDATKLLRERATPVARVAFAVGTLGIGLGGLWAYTVLDWGGYWAWDPVETASLLPWLCLVLFLHLRITPGRLPPRWTAALAVLPGWFAVHATMVTRANGVWASVHAFVGDGMSSERPQSAIVRLLDLRGTGIAGTEVTTYIALLAVTLAILVSWLMIRLSGLGVDLRRWRISALVSLGFVLAVPITRFIFVDLLGEAISPVESAPLWAFVALCTLPLLAVLFPPQTGLAKLLDTPGRAFSLIGAVVLLAHLGDPGVALIVALLMLLKVSDRSGEGTVWTFLGVTALLCALYAFLIDVQSAAIGLLLFLWPLLVKQVDEESSLADSVRGLLVRGRQIRIARHTPLVVGGVFLLLTWMLLLASVDGTSLGAHETLGAPLILAIAAAMATYGWRDVVPAERVPPLLLFLLVLGLVLGAGMNLALPGDADDLFNDYLTRGMVVWLLLPMLMVAIPSIGRLAGKSGLRVRDRWSVAGARTALAHTAHLGILILLVGHLFTTTLVDRTSPEHQVVLPLGEEISHGGLELTFTEWTLLDGGTPEFEERFNVGDGFLGASIEVRDASSGELIDVVQPGMLRFDGWGSFPRSEVDRTIRLTGDVIFIFDWSQTQELGNESMLGGPDSLDRVRLTVYELPVSHLVWLGWATIVLAGLANAALSFSAPKRDAE
jgi:cytochrome c biogenesis factor